jgi:lysophospholipase L1-like esterase
MHRLNPSAWLAAMAALTVGACSTPPGRGDKAELTAGSHYVAMGSSFASGPGLQPASDTDAAARRCTRSSQNYAQQLASRLQLELTDVSCSGAKTSHVLGPWNELPPQVDALRADTRLVTLTIGGNDVGYIGGLASASCNALGLAAQLAGRPCSANVAPTEAAYVQTAAAMRAIVAEIQRRAPRARVVLVDYTRVLPAHGCCELTPLSDADADIGRAVAARLERITADVAHDTGAELLSAAQLSRGHDACSAEAWSDGYAKTTAGSARANYHPNLAGMTAIASALEQRLRSRRAAAR